VFLFQHTHPNSLWTDGRQVCSTWRSEIPKVFAREYLENPDMVQIYFDCGTSRVEGVNCQMGAEMVFDRYEGGAKNRCVFSENPLTTGRKNSGHSETFKQTYELRKRCAWRTGLQDYLGGDPGAREGGVNFDLPPHQIRIKSAANDSELPNLEFDVPKREISFEWKGMFDCFYGEAARQEKRDHAVMSEAAKCLSAGSNSSIVGAMALSKRNKATRRANRKAIRRERIKKWYLENHNLEFTDSLMEEEAEEKALTAIEEFELHGDFVRCAEDAESRAFAESHASKQNMMDMMNFIRESRGIREDDEEGVTALFMQMLSGPPGGAQFPHDDEEEDYEEYEDEDEGEDEEEDEDEDEEGRFGVK
jgi:hypothetical protein